MHTVLRSSISLRQHGRIALVALLALLIAAPTASARSVRDPDIGWPVSLRKQLGLPKVASATSCNREITGRDVRVQNRIDRRAPGLRTALYRIFHDGPTNLWGATWFMACDGGRKQVGVASGGSPREARAAVREARRYLRRKKLTRDVRLVAVRSTYRQLSDQVAALFALEERLTGEGTINWGIEPQRNAVVIEGDHRVPETDRAILREVARTSSVNVIVRFEPAPDPNAPIPTYPVNVVLDRASIDRASDTVSVKITDSSCGATGPDDVLSRFAGVRIRTLPRAYVLAARLRVNPDWSGKACPLDVGRRSSITTTVTLPKPLGPRGLVDDTPGPGGFRFVVLPPEGAKAIRALSPKYQYSGRDCDARDVRAAFEGRRKTEWCFF